MLKPGLYLATNVTVLSLKMPLQGDHMKSNSILKRSAIFVAIIAGTIACSSKPDIKEFPKSANAKEEITNLAAAIENSKSEDYSLLAPVSFKEARNSLKKARTLEKEDKSNEKVLKKVALGQAYIERARENAADNKEKLQDVIAAREAAIAAEADYLLPASLAKLDKKVQIETTKLEEGKSVDNKAIRADLITGYLDLELSSIKKISLGESKFLIDEAIRNGARDLTPKTLADAHKAYRSADQFIIQHRHDSVQIGAQAAIALEAARKLDSTIATTRGLTVATPEETALKMQAEEVLYNKTQNALAEEQSENIALKATNTEMERQRKLNTIYEQARKKFTQEEAEVYKKGNDLVIRLRSLHFPKSKAVLKGSDFALLKKVEEVIVSFDKSSVIVEGHTDSTGGKSINQKISDERAEAVKKYLEANAPDKITEIESHGYGYERPLASNKDAAGRAQNRRVDIVIEPSQL